MVFKLTEAEQQRRVDLLVALETCGETLSNAAIAFNDAVQQAWQAVEQAQQAYNSKVELAQEFMTEVCDSRQEEYDQKADKWQESDPGQAAAGWLEEWSMQLDEVDLDPPEPLEQPDLAAKDTLLQLPPEAS